MESKMRCRLSTWVSLALVTPTLLVAQNGYQPCCDGQLSAYAEALYWAPANCDLPYAEPGVVEGRPAPFVPWPFAFSSSYEQKNLEPNYDWGFRVGATYDKDCWRATLSYHWVESISRGVGKRGPGDNSMTMGTIEAEFFEDGWLDIRASDLHRYQTLDLMAGTVLFRSRCAELFVYGSAQFMTLLEKQRHRGTGIGFGLGEPMPISAINDQRNEFYGFGLGPGFSAAYRLGCGFSLSGGLQTLGLIGRKSDSLSLDFLTTFGPQFAFTDPHNRVIAHIRGSTKTCFSPALKSQVRLAYDFCFGGWEAAAHVGYEMHYFFRILFNLPQDRETAVNSAGFGGPTFGLTVGW